MIVEGYTLNLYCDCPACTKGNRAQVYAQFGAETRIGATRQAKEAGWYLTAEDTRNITYAPGHWPADKLHNRQRVEQRRKAKQERKEWLKKVKQEQVVNKKA